MKSIISFHSIDRWFKKGFEKALRRQSEEEDTFLLLRHEMGNGWSKLSRVIYIFIRFILLHGNFFFEEWFFEMFKIFFFFFEKKVCEDFIHTSTWPIPRFRMANGNLVDIFFTIIATKTNFLQNLSIIFYICRVYQCI